MMKKDKIATMKAATTRNGAETTPKKTARRNSTRASLIQKTATITRFSEVYVRKVTDGNRENSYVMNVYMALQEGENELLAQVKELVPFE